jgi:hypothetical protein
MKCSPCTLNFHAGWGKWRGEQRVYLLGEVEQRLTVRPGRGGRTQGDPLGRQRVEKRAVKRAQRGSRGPKMEIRAPWRVGTNFHYSTIQGKTHSIWQSTITQHSLSLSHPCSDFFHFQFTIMLDQRKLLKASTLPIERPIEHNDAHDLISTTHASRK